MKFRGKPVIIDAIQWFKHGDHPEVLEYGESVLDQFPSYKDCGLLVVIGDYGDKYYQNIIPSDWIITDSDGKRSTCCDKAFKEMYEKVE